jgi:predicted nucleic acid-binding protein
MSSRADRFTVVIDTDVLVGALTRNIILSLAEAGIFRARWSSTTIDDEFVAFFVRKYPDKEALGPKQKGAIERAFPEGRIEVDPRLMQDLGLPDPKDRHVLAAAIQTKAAVIVTNNLKDFPADCLDPFEVQTVSADDFIADCIDLGGPEAVVALRSMRERLQKPEMDAEALILRVEQIGLGQTATLLAHYQAFL